MTMQYCLHPDHIHDGTAPWFIASKPSRLCPRHEVKPRMRLVDGKWEPVEAQKVQS